MHELLKRYIQLNIPVSTENLDEIVKHFKPITAKKNAVLFSHGDTCNKLYFINQGCIRTYYITEQVTKKRVLLLLQEWLLLLLPALFRTVVSFEFVFIFK